MALFSFIPKSIVMDISKIPIELRVELMKVVADMRRDNIGLIPIQGKNHEETLINSYNQLAAHVLKDEIEVQ